jgi:hypothetical protein
MDSVAQERIDKRAASFRALKSQMGGATQEWAWVETLAESYEWMKADRDFWRSLASGREPA